VAGTGRQSGAGCNPSRTFREHPEARRPEPEAPCFSPSPRTPDGTRRGRPWNSGRDWRLQRRRPGAATRVPTPVPGSELRIVIRTDFPFEGLHRHLMVGHLPTNVGEVKIRPSVPRPNGRPAEKALLRNARLSNVKTPFWFRAKEPMRAKESDIDAASSSQAATIGGF
jgi:hypothetical protein